MPPDEPMGEITPAMEIAGMAALCGHGFQPSREMVAQVYRAMRAAHRTERLLAELADQ